MDRLTFVSVLGMSDDQRAAIARFCRQSIEKQSTSTRQRDQDDVAEAQRVLAML